MVKDDRKTSEKHDQNVDSSYPFNNLFKCYDREARALWSQIVSQQRAGKLGLSYIVACVYVYDSTEKTALNQLRTYVE